MFCADLSTPRSRAAHVLLLAGALALLPTAEPASARVSYEFTSTSCDFERSAGDCAMLSPVTGQVDFVDGAFLDPGTSLPTPPELLAGYSITYGTVQVTNSDPIPDVTFSSELFLAIAHGAQWLLYFGASGTWEISDPPVVHGSFGSGDWTACPGCTPIVPPGCLGPQARASSEIINASGNGTALLRRAEAVAIGAGGDVYVAGHNSHNVFRVTSGGIDEVMGPSGSWGGQTLDSPSDLASDASGNIYVAGKGSNNAFSVDSLNNVSLLNPSAAVDVEGITVDQSTGHVYVSGFSSSYAHRASGGVLTEVINSAGDGVCPLTNAHGILADGADSVYVTGYGSDNLFRVDTTGATSPECLMSLAPVAGLPPAPEQPVDIARGPDGMLYVTGGLSDEVVRIDPTTNPVTVTPIIDATGDGQGNVLDGPSGVAVDHKGNVFVTGQDSDNVFQIAPDGTITEIMNLCGDGRGNLLRGPNDLAVDGRGNVYVTGEDSNNAFRINAPPTVPTLLPLGALALCVLLGQRGSALLRRS
jgi:uncharacterized protein YjiK